MNSLIAVEGCVGVGKTTIARGLAELRGTRLLLEDYASVPFLEAFYADPVGCALETEFGFLLQHYHQLQMAAREPGQIIADFAIHKNLIFANLNMLALSALKVFGELFEILAARVPVPAVTVFLSAPDDLILKRIRERGRSFELAVSPQYYRALNAGYETFFAQRGGVVVRVPVDQMNFCTETELYHWLSREIDARLP